MTRALYNVIIVLKKYKTPSFRSSMMPKSNIHQENRDLPNLTLFCLRHKYFKNSFFSFAIVEYNKSSPLFLTLDYGDYLINVLVINRAKLKSVYEIHNPLE